MDEEKKIYYATFDEAVENAAIPKGQLPPIIPSSAKDISVRYFIDLPLVWVKFTADPDDFFELLTHLTPLSSQEIRSLGHEIYAVPEWWPDTLTESDLKDAQDDVSFVIARYDYAIEYGNHRTEFAYGHFFLYFTTGEAYYFGGKKVRSQHQSTGASPTSQRNSSSLDWDGEKNT
jgi:hypothetical protein